MTVAMDWNNLNFKASDVVKLVLGIVTAVWASATINNRLNNVSDNQIEMRKTQIEFIKDYYTDRENTRNEIGVLKIDLRLLNMRVEALEKTKK